MQTRKLLEEVNSLGVVGIGGELTSCDVLGETVDRSGWWSELGVDSRENGMIAAQAWRSVGEGCAEVAAIVERSDVALAEFATADGDSRSAIVYSFDPEGVGKPIGCVGFLPAVDENHANLQHLNPGIRAIYQGLHDGLILDVRSPGRSVAQLAEMVSWADWVGIDDPEDFEADASFGYDVPYIPDPRNLMMVFNGDEGSVFCDVASPESPWYQAGDVFCCPRVDSTGMSVTPALVLQRFILSTLGCPAPLL